MFPSRVRKIFSTGGAALLFAALFLCGDGSASPLRFEGQEKPKPVPGPLGPAQAGPRKDSTSTKSSGGPSEMKPAHTYHITGVIRSLTDTTLVLSTRGNAKSMRRSFTLTTVTTKEGELKAGARATVYYTVEKGKRVATRVVVASSAPPAQSKN